MYNVEPNGNLSAAAISRDAMHGISTPEIVHGYCQYAIYRIYAVTV